MDARHAARLGARGSRAPENSGGQSRAPLRVLVVARMSQRHRAKGACRWRHAGFIPGYRGAPGSMASDAELRRAPLIRATSTMRGRLTEARTWRRATAPP